MSFCDRWPILAAVLFGLPPRIKYEHVAWNTDGKNNWWRMVTIGRVYTILATANTNLLAESLGYNICNKRGLVVSEWFGKVEVRVNMERGVWTAPIVLETSDLKG